MGKKSAAFTENQFVFAKVKGYSPWPAKITKVIAKSRYGVFFYGTMETASVKSEDLDLYDEKKAKYNTERQMKKHDYKQAVDQIEAAIAGNDIAPATIEFDQTASDLTIDVNETTILDDSSSIPPPETPTQTQSQQEEPDKQQINETIESTPPSSAPVTPVPAVTVKNNIISESASPTIEYQVKENVEERTVERKSRSGRTIKEKKINDDEMDPDEVFTHPRKRVKLDSDVKQKPATPANNNHNITPSLSEFRASKIHILQDPEKKLRLSRQYDMISATHEIRNVLGLKTVDVERAVELLEEFKELILPQITEVTLLKYPNTVDTIKRLRKYIGNVNKWGWDEIQVEKFNEKAAKIRSLAQEIFESFKKLFNFNEDSPLFWNKFADRQKKFNEKYNALNEDDLFEGLSEEDLDTLLVSSKTNPTNNENNSAQQEETATTS